MSTLTPERADRRQRIVSAVRAAIRRQRRKVALRTRVVHIRGRRW